MGLVSLDNDGRSFCFLFFRASKTASRWKGAKEKPDRPYPTPRGGLSNPESLLVFLRNASTSNNSKQVWVEMRDQATLSCSREPKVLKGQVVISCSC